MTKVLVSDPIDPAGIDILPRLVLVIPTDCGSVIDFRLRNSFGILERQLWRSTLGFSSSKNSSEIIINSSTFSQISEIENHLFENPISTTDLTWRWDNPKGVYYGVAFNTPKSSSSSVLLSLKNLVFVDVFPIFWLVVDVWTVSCEECSDL